MSAIPNLPTDTPVIHTNGNTNDTASTSFKLSDTPVENFRPLKVIVIGAGYSGIYCGIRIPERLRNVELVIYEKNAGVGGTWYENRWGMISTDNRRADMLTLPRYLGCACDVPCQSRKRAFEIDELTALLSPFVPVLFRSEPELVRSLRSGS
jgi:hypothetical protein